MITVSSANVASKVFIDVGILGLYILYRIGDKSPNKSNLEELQLRLDAKSN